jgi:protoporphyrin/coproporphyrin ferrochelatase
MVSKAAGKIGVVIMTYGSATTADHVDEYMRDIYKDKIPEGLVEDFAERYRLVGRSPLVEITEQQAILLGRELNGKGGQRYVVQAGMLHSHPFIEEAVKKCRQEGAVRIIGIILSPQFSSFIMEGYRTALTAACQAQGYGEHDVAVAGPWPTESHFIELLSKRVTDALASLHKQFGANVPVVFTTHSLPERVVAKDPQYLEQLQATAEAVVAKLDDPSLEWYRGYQSAGHTPEPWLKPDLVDILAELRDKHDKAVLIVPIQFLADHLEILYDLDIAGSEQCREYGISYNRIELPNVDPLFIQTLASVTRETVHNPAF